MIDAALEHARRAALRVRIVSALAALAIPCGLLLLRPGLAPPSIVRALGAAAMALAVATLIAAASEWRSGRRLARTRREVVRARRR
jgi:hypothetical protein